MSKINKLKLMCLFLSVVGFCAVLLTNNLFNRTARAFSFGVPERYSSAPGEQNCTACHAGVPDTGPGRFTIIAPLNYEPGQIYPITVQHATEDTTRMRWGFQLTALTYNNISARAGGLQSLDGLTTTIEGLPPFNRQYISHNSTGTFVGQRGGAGWTFNWTAPPTNIGPVVFYAAGNQANGNMSPGGDQIYTARVVVRPTVAAESIADPGTPDGDSAPSALVSSPTVSK